MVAIPVAGNLVTTCYDFRLLLAAPFAAILIVLPIFTAARMVGSIVEELRNGGDRAFDGEEEPSVHRPTRRAFAKDVWRRWQETKVQFLERFGAG